jgi:hypothetical protein
VTRAKTYQTEQNFLCAIGPKHLRTAVQGRHPLCRANVRFGKANICSASTHVCFTSESGHVQRN